jgi:tetratricopeptide (TPR) repeat protein
LVDRDTNRSGEGTDGTQGRRLIGWKAIGQFLGCTERTARRWEVDRLLPVHRIPGGSRSSVWADTDELASWLRALPSDLQATLRTAPATPAAETPTNPAPGAVTLSPAATESVPRPLHLLPVGAALLLLVGIAAALAWTFAARTPHPAAAQTRGPYDDNAEARETYMTARFELSARSADSLAAAEQGFRQLVERYPERAAGWSGLADTYLLLREFGSMRDEDAYPQAERAARTALALDPQLVDAWLDQAFVAWWWQGDGVTAFRAFTTALQLDPNSAKALHWYATALYAHGDFERSLQTIARARALDPNSRAIVADEAWLRFGAGQHADSLATLERLTRLDSNFEAPHFYLAHVYLILLRDDDFLREAQTAAQLRGQADALAGLRLAEQRFRSGGRQAMLDQLSANEAQGLAHGTGSAVIVAEYRALANDRDGMLQWLAVAAAQHDYNLPSLRGYPEFAAYRNDPAFLEILKRLP